MDVIALDIETKNLDISNLDFNDPQGWNVACVSIFEAQSTPITPTFKGHRYATPADLKKREFEFLALSDFEQLNQQLEKWYQAGYTLITKNGYNFDLPIISKSEAEGGCGVGETLKKFETANRHLDLQKYLEDSTDGVRFSLQNLIKSVLGTQESKLMAADQAPQSWAVGDYMSVVEYCDADAEYTYKVWQKARQKGSLQCIGKKDGQEHNCVVKIKW